MDFHDKQQLKMLRAEIDIALKPLGAKYGINLKADRMTIYSANQVVIKLECSQLQQGVVVDKYMDAFKQFYGSYGLLETDLGRKFEVQNKVYELHGLAPSRSRFPIVGRRDGKLTLFTRDVVKQLHPLGLPISVNKQAEN